MQYVLLNGRAIRDRALQHALSEAYRGLVLTGRYPIAFLRIEMPPETVDVNVHPTKLEVRFADSGRLYSQLLGTLRTKFLTVDLNTKLRAEGAAGRTQGAAAGAWNEGPVAIVDPTFAVDQRSALQQREELVAWAKGELAGQESGVGSQEFGSGGRKPLELVRINRPPLQTSLQTSEHGPPVSAGQSTDEKFERPLAGPFSKEAAAVDSSRPDPALTDMVGRNASRRPLTPVDWPVPAMQVHNRYLIAESDEGVVVIDQHALHERILYEQLRERVLAGALETQRLLVPEAVDLSPTEAAAALTNQDLLAKLGVEVAPFGGDTVLVTSYPAMLANFRPAEVLHDLVARLLAEGKQPDRRDMVDELLHMIACKAAIKAGDRLSPEEIAALVEMRHLAQDSHHCPHGRPTALVFTREELDRQFLRT
jgi:DNA mismatch repair protein MutL